MARDWAPDHRRRRLVTPDEARIWRAIVRDVAPLPGRTVEDEPETQPEPSAPAADPAPRLPSPREVLPPPRPRAPLPELAHGRAAGVDKRTAERMKKGEMVIDARIDLHGMTQDTAHATLLAVVGRAFEAGRRCVLVITGKGREGGGILRAQVPRWLNQSPLRERILGFSYARPQHGGEGALYVLVKRRRE
ncbi:MAG: Smr/MutS family protein [Solirubrobacterales bacterium]